MKSLRRRQKLAHIINTKLKGNLFQNASQVVGDWDFARKQPKNWIKVTTDKKPLTTTKLIFHSLSKGFIPTIYRRRQDAIVWVIK